MVIGDKRSVGSGWGHIAAINGLGPAGQSYTRSGLSFANGHAFAHTIRELICIGM